MAPDPFPRTGFCFPSAADTCVEVSPGAVSASTVSTMAGGKVERRQHGGDAELERVTREAFQWLYDAGFVDEVLTVAPGYLYLTLTSGWGSVWITVGDRDSKAVDVRAAPRGHTSSSAKSLQTLMAGQGLTPVTVGYGFPPPDQLRPILADVSSALRDLGIENEDRLIEVDEAARNLSASEQWGANAVPPKRFGW